MVAPSGVCNLAATIKSSILSNLMPPMVLPATLQLFLQVSNPAVTSDANSLVASWLYIVAIVSIASNGVDSNLPATIDPTATYTAN